MSAFLAKIASALFGAIFGAVSEHLREARRDAKLEELGWNKNELERLRVERHVMRRAREIEDSTPADLDDALRELTDSKGG